MLAEDAFMQTSLGPAHDQHAEPARRPRARARSRSCHGSSFTGDGGGPRSAPLAESYRGRLLASVAGLSRSVDNPPSAGRGHPLGTEHPEQGQRLGLGGCPSLAE